VNRAKSGVAAVFMLAALTGCSDFERIDFQYSADLPLDILVSYEEIRMPAGVAVTAVARPMADGGLMARDTLVELSSENPGILGVAFALPNKLGTGTENADWTFVLFAVNAGSTEVTVRVDGETNGEIPVTILPQ
jgi:hypothetical protein